MMKNTLSGVAESDCLSDWLLITNYTKNNSQYGPVILVCFSQTPVVREGRALSHARPPFRLPLFYLYNKPLISFVSTRSGVKSPSDSTLPVSFP